MKYRIDYDRWHKDWAILDMDARDEYGCPDFACASRFRLIALIKCAWLNLKHWMTRRAV